MKTEDFALILKELQLVYGPRIKIEDVGYSMTVTIYREKGSGQLKMFSPKRFRVRFGNSKMDGRLRQDVVTEIVTGSISGGKQIHPRGFRNYVRKLLDNPVKL
jgi:hypothetical protein